MAQERVRFSIDKDVGLHNTTLLESALASMPGIASVQIDKDNSCVSVGFDRGSISQEAIKAKIEILGYPIQHS